MASSSIIQSSSSSSDGMIIRKYDVFVSFRGQDTRYNFTDHLFAALRRKGILAFRDDTKLEKGQPILSNLIQAIQASHIFVIVLSKNYASSTWCLRELENILDCVKLSQGRHVLPIFYDVDPSEVRKQTGDYGKAMATHEKKFKEDSEKMEEVKRWRGALTQVANLSGWDMRNKSQNAEIEKIVQKIISMLGHDFSSFANDLVGIESPLEELENLLLLDAVNNVRTIGICGMGGGGKTTLASVLYHKISHQYDAHCFIDLSKTYTKRDPIAVVKQLLLQTLNEENLQICNLYHAANLVQSRLLYVKTLIVLDNVDQVGQQEELVVKCEWLGAGSKIIITSRDQHALTEFGVHEVYKVQLLNHANALKLFCKKAFKCDDIVGDYKELTSKVLEYANRLPLAVKVLGSFLCGRSVSEWRSALVRMKENPNKDILDVLQISYDGLQDFEKQIFLDIACFFDGRPELYVKEILNCCGFHSEIGIRVLLDKSLIEIDEDENIEMHDLLKDLGRKIVKGNSTKEPEKWSRLWRDEDIYDVMSKALEITNTEAIVSYYPPDDVKKPMCDAQGLSKMSNLRLLILYQKKFMGRLNCLSNELQYLAWWDYPFSYLPSCFQPNKLVELDLSFSSIKQLWKGIKVSQEPATPIDSIHIVIPGHQIPGWFINQSVGNSINLDPTPIMHDSSNWVGIVFGVVFMPLKLDTTRQSHLIFIALDGIRTLYTRIRFDKEAITVKSHHLWLVYLTREKLLSHFKIEKMLDLSCITMVGWGLGWMVSSCGYQWVLKEDLKNLKPTMMRMRREYNIQVDDDFVKGSSILSLEAGK